ncbi:putative VacJ family lipoprotein [Candidatus Terasakiella magnetica]|nr:putative VacJ family lipoprotein [Candidatus Terasakiella magnetica]
MWPLRRGTRLAVLVLVVAWALPAAAEGERPSFRSELRQAVDAADHKPQAAAKPVTPPQALPPPDALAAPVAHPPPAAAKPSSLDPATVVEVAEPWLPRPPPPHRRMSAGVMSAAVTRELVNPRPAALSSALADPFEGLNRNVHALNVVAIHYIMSPASRVYSEFIPGRARTAVANLFRNLREPVYLISAVMQGEWRDAWVILSRFVINSTLGIGGLLDPASSFGYSQKVRPLDQALCRWGLDPGPYVVLPLFGPSSLRDTAGRGATLVGQIFLLGPFVIPYRLTDTMVQYASLRDTWEAMEVDASDGYERLRGIYEVYSKIPCGARNAADNGLFFQ